MMPGNSYNRNDWLSPIPPPFPPKPQQQFCFKPPPFVWGRSRQTFQPPPLSGAGLIKPFNPNLCLGQVSSNLWTPFHVWDRSRQTFQPPPSSGAGPIKPFNPLPFPGRVSSNLSMSESTWWNWHRDVVVDSSLWRKELTQSGCTTQLTQRGIGSAILTLNWNRQGCMWGVTPVSEFF